MKINLLENRHTIEDRLLEQKNLRDSLQSVIAKRGLGAEIKA